jgi:hypothetical protein
MRTLAQVSNKKSSNPRCRRRKRPRVKVRRKMKRRRRSEKVNALFIR